MKAYPWKSWVFLSLASLLAVGVVRMLLDPTMGKPQSFNFPNEISVKGWRVSKVDALEHPEQYRADILASRRYLYQAATGGQVLTVDSRYYITRKIPAQTGELLNAFMMKRTYGGKPLPFQLSQREFSPGNYYDLFHYQQRAYLSACIDPKGFSNVSTGQLRQRQLDQRRDGLKVLNWLFSPAPLMDERCVWTQLSMPYTGNDPQPTYQQLGQFWEQWLPWWRQNYPKLLPY
jgi:cyanosortase A-associated protein